MPERHSLIHRSIAGRLAPSRCFRTSAVLTQTVRVSTNLRATATKKHRKLPPTLGDGTPQTGKSRANSGGCGADATETPLRPHGLNVAACGAAKVSNRICRRYFRRLGGCCLPSPRSLPGAVRPRGPCIPARVHGALPARRPAGAMPHAASAQGAIRRSCWEKT